MTLLSVRGEDGGRVAQHAPNAQQQQHEEVEHGPRLRHLHVLDGLRVNDESQASALDSLCEQEDTGTHLGKLGLPQDPCC